jgi:hypothetical protein
MRTKIYPATAYQADERIVEVTTTESGTAFWKHPKTDYPHGTFSAFFATFSTYRKAISTALALGYAVRVDQALQDKMSKTIGGNND